MVNLLNAGRPPGNVLGDWSDAFEPGGVGADGAAAVQIQVTTNSVAGAFYLNNSNEQKVWMTTLFRGGIADADSTHDLYDYRWGVRGRTVDNRAQPIAAVNDPLPEDFETFVGRLPIAGEVLGGLLTATGATAYSTVQTLATSRTLIIGHEDIPDRTSVQIESTIDTGTLN